MSNIGGTRLNLLLFSVSGVHFAVDADQVAEIADYDGEPTDDLFWFHEELAYGAQTAGYISPTVITVRTDDTPLYRVIIDAMEDIAEFNLDDFQLFPPLLEPFVKRSGLWGILPRNGVLVLLVNFQHLLQQKRHVIN